MSSASPGAKSRSSRGGRPEAAPGGTERKALQRDQVEELFLRYRGEIHLFLARRLANPDLARDLTQETFARLLGAEAAETVGNVRAWLYRTAHHLAVDHRRKQLRQQTVSLPGDALSGYRDELPSSETRAADREALLLLQRALAELPELTREIFRLTRIEGLSYAETARQLSVSESSVQKHLARALRHAAARLRDGAGEAGEPR